MNSVLDSENAWPRCSLPHSQPRRGAQRSRAHRASPDVCAPAVHVRVREGLEPLVFRAIVWEILLVRLGLLPEGLGFAFDLDQTVPPGSFRPTLHGRRGHAGQGGRGGWKCLPEIQFPPVELELEHTCSAAVVVAAAGAAASIPSKKSDPIPPPPAFLLDLLLKAERGGRARLQLYENERKKRHS
jgi:hypothetical protein